MAENEKKKSEFLMYKGKPLQLKENKNYYGKMRDTFETMLNMLATKDVKGLQVADKVSVQLINTDPDVRPHDRIAHKTEKKSLSAAIDIGRTWLERALES